MNQLSLEFNPDITKAYSSCREYVAARVHQISIPQKVIAADMDYAPTDLSRKLAQSPNDSRRFTCDDLELYVQKTQDTEPIKYLAAKYLYKREPEELQRQIEELQSQLDDLNSTR